MKKTRIRYKRLFFFLACFLIVLGLLAYGILFIIQWILAAPKTESISSQPPSQYYLFVGTNHEGPSQADSLILVSVNPQQKKMYAISLPGNTKISRNDEPLLLLKDAYTDGDAEKTVSAVENLLHIRIGRYAIFDNATFSALMDRFGGIDLYVEKNMSHTDASGAEDIALRQGFQTLEGNDAYGYLRFLDEEGGEISRIQREERFIKAFLNQSRNHFRIYTWGLVRYYWNALDTNISQAEAADLAYDISRFPADQLYFTILPGETRSYEHVKVWEINPVEIQEIVGLTIEQEQKQGEKE